MVRYADRYGISGAHEPGRVNAVGDAWLVDATPAQIRQREADVRGDGHTPVAGAYPRPPGTLNNLVSYLTHQRAGLRLGTPAPGIPRTVAAVRELWTLMYDRGLFGPVGRTPKQGSVHGVRVVIARHGRQQQCPRSTRSPRRVGLSGGDCPSRRRPGRPDPG
jgi:hypothetical protein